MGKIIIALVALLISSLSSYAMDKKAGSLVISDIYARPTIGQIANSAAYMKISNAGPEDDRLLSVRTDIADLVEVHTHMKENGTMLMMQVEEPVVIPAKGAVVFQSGGLHVMIMGLKKKLTVGMTIPLELQFEKHGTVSVIAQVRKPDIKNMHRDHSGHNM